MRKTSADLLFLLLLVPGCAEAVRPSGSEGGVDAAMEASVMLDTAPEARPEASVDSPPDVAELRDVSRVDQRLDTLARVPPPPTMPTPFTDTTRVFVVRRFRFGFGSRAEWGTHGFDRDNINTENRTDPAQQSCRPRGTAETPLDGFDGRDNVFGVVGSLFEGTGWNEASSNDGINQGYSSMAVRISARDGRPIIEWLPVVQGHRPDNPMAAPAFDGRDVWHVNRTTAYTPGTTTPRFRAEGYLNGTQLVMPQPANVPWLFMGSRFPLRLQISSGFAVGSYERSELGTVEFSGIWPFARVLEDLDAAGICPTNPREYDFFFRVLSDAADVLSSGETSSTAVCDALSLAMGLEFVPATLGDDVAMPPRAGCL